MRFFFIDIPNESLAGQHRIEQSFKVTHCLLYGIRLFSFEDASKVEVRPIGLALENDHAKENKKVSTYYNVVGQLVEIVGKILELFLLDWVGRVLDHA